MLFLANDGPAVNTSSSKMDSRIVTVSFARVAIGPVVYHALMVTTGEQKAPANLYTQSGFIGVLFSLSLSLVRRTTKKAERGGEMASVVYLIS